MKHHILPALAATLMATLSPALPAVAKDNTGIRTFEPAQNGILRKKSVQGLKQATTKIGTLKANLVITPRYPGNGPQGGSGFCHIAGGQTQIAFKVRNTGQAKSDATSVELDFPGYGKFVFQNVGALTPGAQQNVIMPVAGTIPNGSIASFSVWVDPYNKIPETSEQNSVNGQCLVLQKN